MKKFIVKTVTFLLLLFVIAELVSRLIVDPFYFYTTDRYNLRFSESSLKEIYFLKNTEKVDYLFIGSSRVPATINPSVIRNVIPDKNVVVAGRGFMTKGIHYQALKNRLLEFPDYLKGAKIFLEYPGSGIYTSSFREDKLKVYEPVASTDKAMPQMLLPHLQFKSLLAFLEESKNSVRVKIDMVLLYYFSSYRTSLFVNEKVKRLDSFLLIKDESEQKLVSEGGIRNDNFDLARQKAVAVAALESGKIEASPALSLRDLDNSTLAYLKTLIDENGGTLYLYKMPLSSIQEQVHNSQKARQNQKIFEEWISAEGLHVFSSHDFHYIDSDFPDTWHLSIDRRDEFTMLLLDEIKIHENTKKVLE